MWRLWGEVVPLGIVIRSLCLLLSLVKQVTCWVSQARIDWGHSLSVCPPQAVLCGSGCSHREDACKRKGFPNRITLRRLRLLWWYLVAEDSILCPVGDTPLWNGPGTTACAQRRILHWETESQATEQVRCLWHMNSALSLDFPRSGIIQIRDGYGEHRQPGRCSWISVIAPQVISPHSQDPRVIPLWLHYINTFKINFPLK